MNVTPEDMVVVPRFSNRPELLTVVPALKLTVPKLIIPLVSIPSKKPVFVIVEDTVRVAKLSINPELLIGEVIVTAKLINLSSPSPGTPGIWFPIPSSCSQMAPLFQSPGATLVYAMANASVGVANNVKTATPIIADKIILADNKN